MANVPQPTKEETANDGTLEDDIQPESSLQLERLNTSRPPSHSSSGSKQSSPAHMPSLQNAKHNLIKYSALPLSQSRPPYPDTAYNKAYNPLFSDKQDDVISYKRKSSDRKNRIKKVKDDIVLSPQRRSNETGCHVIPQSSLAKRPGSPTDNQDFNKDRNDHFNQDHYEKDRHGLANCYNRNDRRSRGGRGHMLPPLLAPPVSSFGGIPPPPPPLPVKSASQIPIPNTEAPLLPPKSAEQPPLPPPPPPMAENIKLKQNPDKENLLRDGDYFLGDEFYCSRCKKSIQRQKYRKHLREVCAEVKRLFWCRICENQSFTRFEDMKRHFVIKHCCYDVTLCDICNCGFNNADAFVSHLKYDCI